MRAKKKTTNKSEKLVGVRRTQAINKKAKETKQTGFKLRKCSVLLDQIPSEMLQIKPLKLIETGDDGKTEQIYEFDEKSPTKSQSSGKLDDFFKELQRQKKIEVKKYKKITNNAEKVKQTTKKVKPLKRKAVPTSAIDDKNKKLKKTNLENVDRENMKPVIFKPPMQRAIVLLKQIDEHTLNAAMKNSAVNVSKKMDENVNARVLRNRSNNNNNSHDDASNNKSENSQSNISKENLTLRQIPQINKIQFQSTPKAKVNLPKATSIFNNASPLADITNISTRNQTRQKLNFSNSISITTSNDEIMIFNNKENSKISKSRSTIKQVPSVSLDDAEFSIFDLDSSNIISTNHVSIFSSNRDSMSGGEKTPEKKIRSYERTPLKNITNNVSSKLHKNSNNMNNSMRSAFANNSDIADERDITLTEGIDKSSDKHFFELNENANIDNLYGFIDDDDDDDADNTKKSVKHIVIDKSVLNERRKQLRRFLENPSSQKSQKPQKKKSPTKQSTPTKRDSSINTSIVQKDIRTAFNPCTYVDYSKGPQTEPENPLDNFFGETETERAQDRRRSYSRPNKRRYNPIIEIDSESESEPEEVLDEDEPKKKTKKKTNHDKENYDTAELEKFATEFNQMCDEVDSFEPVYE